jgi:hypothetical protein
MVIKPDSEFETYRKVVADSIAVQLGNAQGLEFQRVTECFADSLKPEAPAGCVAKPRTSDEWASLVMVHCSAKLLLKNFRGLVRTDFQKNKVWKERLSQIAQWLLPFAYDTELLMEVRRQVIDGKVHFICEDVPNLAIVELIMAGVSKKQAHFRAVKRSNDMVGTVALWFEQPPIFPPGDGSDKEKPLVNVANSVLRQLLSVTEMALEYRRPIRPETKADIVAAGRADMVALGDEFDELAYRLGQSLNKSLGLPDVQRVDYCVVDLPKRDLNSDFNSDIGRRFALQVLDKIHESVPGLLFVEPRTIRSRDVDLETLGHLNDILNVK